MTAFPHAVPSRRRRIRRAGLLVPAALALPLVGAACAGSDEPDAAAATDAPAVMHVDEPYGHADAAELSQASDAVVRGTVVAAEDGLHIGDNDLQFVAYTVEVDEAMAGTPADRIEVVLESRLDTGRQVVMEGRPVPAVGDEGLWFLTRIDPEFHYDGYVLTAQSGLLLLDGDEVIGGGTDEAPLHQEVERLDSADEVVDHVRAVAD